MKFACLGLPNLAEKTNAHRSTRLLSSAYSCSSSTSKQMHTTLQEERVCHCVLLKNREDTLTRVTETSQCRSYGYFAVRRIQSKSDGTRAGDLHSSRIGLSELDPLAGGRHSVIARR